MSKNVFTVAHLRGKKIPTKKCWMFPTIYHMFVDILKYYFCIALYRPIKNCNGLLKFLGRTNSSVSEINKRQM